MFKTVITEFNTALKRKYTLIYLISLAALVILANAAVVGFRLIYGDNEGTFAYNLLEYATWCFVIPYYSCIFISDIVFGDKYPSEVLGKSGSVRLYFSKLIASIMLAAVFLIAAFGLLIGVTALFQISAGGLEGYMILSFVRKMVIAIPLWFAGVCFANMCLFSFPKKKTAFVIFAIIVLVIPRIIMIFAAEPFRIAAFRVLRVYTITQNISLIPYPADPARNIPLTIALGIIYGIFAMFVGFVVFCVKDKDDTAPVADADEDK